MWLKYSECLSALGLVKESAEAYGKVVELAPNHVSARVQLSLLQQQLGMDKEALHTLAEGGGGSCLFFSFFDGFDVVLCAYCSYSLL